jgi:calcium-dependent protein kinase
MIMDTTEQANNGSLCTNGRRNTETCPDDPMSDRLSLRSQFVLHEDYQGNARWTGLNNDSDSQDDVLGAGEFGTVVRRRHDATGSDRALKTMNKAMEQKWRSIVLEAQVMRAMDHPHILRIFSWGQEGPSAYIVMECCEGGCVADVIRTVRQIRREKECHGCGAKGCNCVIPDEWAATACRQMFEAMAHCHDKGVLHKDLKAENILLLRAPRGSGFFEDQPHTVIADFGLAEVLAPNDDGQPGFKRGKKVEGSPATMAPEVFNKNCSFKCDVWSLGCVVFKLISGRLPFVPKPWGPPPYGKVLQPLQLAGPNWDYMKPSSKDKPKEYKQATSLCKKLLRFEEDKRPTCRQALEHPWFRNSWREAFAGQLESVIEAAKAWPNRSLLERSLCLEMAAQHDGIDRCANTFSQFDSTDTGSLTQAELVEALTWADLDEPEAKKAAAALDFNGDGKCEYFEFAAACLPMDGRRFEEMLWQEFRGLLDSVTLKPGEPPRVTLKPLLDRLMLPANAAGPITAPDQELSFEDFCALFGLRVGSAGKDPFKRRNFKVSNDSFGTGSTLTTGGAGDTESGSASSGNGQQYETSFLKTTLGLTKSSYRINMELATLMP